jgi:ABC-2 type transport system permease protein
MTTETGSLAPALPDYPAPQRMSQARVLRSEWTKLRTQPSAVWALLSTAVLMVGIGALYCLLRVARPPHGAAAISSFDPAGISLAGVNLAQIAVGVLGVLLISSEYATGLIRASFAAVPTRLPVLWGKAVVFALATLTVCVPAALVAFGAGQSILSRHHLGTTLSQPGVARAVLGSALYLAVVGLLGLGLGALLRSTAGAVASLLGVLFAFQFVVALLPGSWSDHIYKYLPGPAGIAVTAASPDSSSLAPWAGLGLFCLYTAVVLGLAAGRMHHGDA